MDAHTLSSKITWVNSLTARTDKARELYTRTLFGTLDKTAVYRAAVRVHFIHSTYILSILYNLQWGPIYVSFGLEKQIQKTRDRKKTNQFGSNVVVIWFYNICNVIITNVCPPTTYTLTFPQQKARIQRDTPPYVDGLLISFYWLHIRLLPTRVPADLVGCEAENWFIM